MCCRNNLTYSLGCVPGRNEDSSSYTNILSLILATFSSWRRWWAPEIQSLALMADAPVLHLFNLTHSAELSLWFSVAGRLPCPASSPVQGCHLLKLFPCGSPTKILIKPSYLLMTGQQQLTDHSFFSWLDARNHNREENFLAARAVRLDEK